MSKDNKLISARQAAQIVLAKTHELLAKSETLKKYETENRKAPPSVKYGKIETDQKPTERDYNEYNVKSGSSKDSKGPRVAKQVSPSGNPKEEAEGNNKPDGMEPRYEFKDKVAKELAKENAAAKGMPKDKNGNPGLGKAENPDKEADAKLGEKVEKDVEEHMLENKDAEKKEGHKIMEKSSKFKRCVKDVKENSPGVNSPEAVCVAEGVKPEQQKAEGETEHAMIPRLIGSAKLSKFMEYRHAKKKAQEAAQAAGHQAAGAPEQGSAQDGRPDESRPTSQPTRGDMDKATGHEKGVAMAPSQGKGGVSSAGMAVKGANDAQRLKQAALGEAKKQSIGRMMDQEKIKPNLPPDNSPVRPQGMPAYPRKK
jgi:hypothetical protein